LAGFTWSVFRVRVRLWGGIGGVGGIVATEFGVKGLHFLHANVVSCAQLEFMHGCGWVEVYIVGERSGL